VILNNYIIVTLEDGSSEVIFSNIIKSDFQFSQHIHENIVSNEYYEKFAKEADRHEFFRWPAKDIINTIFNESKCKIIDFTDYGSIADMYGNLFFGQAISNLLFTINNNNIINRQIYGCQYLLIK
jgi:hypothetical protein